jgi:hypothetical protein
MDEQREEGAGCRMGAHDGMGACCGDRRFVFTRKMEKELLDAPPRELVGTNARVRSRWLGDRE